MSGPGPLVLLIEDEPQMRRFLRAALAPRGFRLVEAENAAEGEIAAGSHHPDIVLLDLGLPDRDGIELAKRLRAFTQAPILVLSARGREADKVEALDAGADDYLTKPFELPELEARLEALVARSKGRARRRVLTVHDLALDLDTLEASRAGTRLHLYPACRKLLEALMQASPAAVTRERLEHALWGDEPPDGDMLRSHIYELRRSVDGPFPVKLIHTLPRTGYRIGL